MVKAVLRSPLHFLLSASVLLLTFVGRRSGRRFTTPLRYVRENGRILCFSSEGTQWWRNLRGGAPVSLRLRGKNVDCTGRTLNLSIEERTYLLTNYLAKMPQDAAYHEVRLDHKKLPVESDLAKAAETVVIVEFPLDHGTP